MKTDVVRNEVVALLSRAQAHAMPDQVFDAVPQKLRHARPKRASHSVWEILEHMRLAQEDILRYVVDPSWVSPSFPEGYWPDPKVEPDDAAWSSAMAGFQADLARLVALAQDVGTDLTAPLPHAPKHTCLRELLIVADHNAFSEAATPVKRF